MGNGNIICGRRNGYWYLLLTFLTIVQLSCNNSGEVDSIVAHISSYDQNIAGIWSKIDVPKDLEFIAITDAAELFVFSRGNRRHAFNIERTELVQVGSSTYTPADQWNDDITWKQNWDSLSNKEKELYLGLENFKEENSWYYLILANGDLVEGSFTSLQYREDLLVKYRLLAARFEQ